jgi:acetyl-CoA synthetase (ADP-forming)/acetyltransferase
VIDLRQKLERAFNPRTVAVVGDKRALGYLWLNAMKTFQGKVYSVQISKDEIPGIEALNVPNYFSLLDIPDELDYVVCAVRRDISPSIVADCARKGVAAVSLFTSGFAETEQEEGVRLQRELGELARANGLLLIGPNCMGVYNPRLGLRQSPEQPAGEAGNVGFISQSGTHCINFSLLGYAHGVRCSKTVSYGNAEVLDAPDYLDYLTDDPETQVIGMYIEGPKDGRRFFAALRRACGRKPVVVWKGGQTDAGARAIFSHTAALASEGRIWDAAVRQAGALSVDSIEEMVDVVKGLLYTSAGGGSAWGGKPGTGNRVGLIAMTGGQSVVIADAFAQAGLEVPLLSAASYEKLGSFFNIIGGSYRNPLDAGGTLAMGFRVDNLQRMLDILDDDPNVDAIAIETGVSYLARRGALHSSLLKSLLDVLSGHKERSRKPFLLILQAGAQEKEIAEVRGKFLERGIAAFGSFQQGANALAKIITYHRLQAEDKSSAG